MDDGKALLRAVLESPEADGPRLAYADWLLKAGDPVRAHFIRLQVRLAARDTKGTVSERRWLRDTLRRFRYPWSPIQGKKLRISSEGPAIKVLKGQLLLRFRRGFVEQVSGPPVLWLNYHDVLTESCPVREVRFPGRYPLTWHHVFEALKYAGAWMQTAPWIEACARGEHPLAFYAATWPRIQFCSGCLAAAGG